MHNSSKLTTCPTLSAQPSKVLSIFRLSLSTNQLTQRTRYLERKIFSLWHERMRFMQFARLRHRMRHRLCWHSDDVAPAHLSLRDQYRSLAATPLVGWHTGPPKALELRAFVDIQKTQREAVSKVLRTT